MLVVTVTYARIPVSVAATRPVTAEDCVGVKYPFYFDNHNNGDYGTIKISPSGDKVAYLVLTPNLSRNFNEYELYVKDLSDTSRRNGRLIASGLSISHIEWTNQGQSIAMLEQVNDRVIAVSVDVSTGKQTPFIEGSQSVVEYEIDVRGDVAIFTLQDAGTDQKTEPQGDPARGYRQLYQYAQNEVSAKTRLLIIRRNPDGNWSSPTQISFRDPLGSKTISEFATYGYSQHLSLSPDGNYLLIRYFTDRVPPDWETDPYVKQFRTDGAALAVTALYDIDSKSAKLALNAGTALTSIPVWSPDGRYFIMGAPSPIGSKWRQDDIASNYAGPKDTNVFRVDVSSGRIEEISRHLAEWEEGPLSVQEDGTVSIRSSQGVVDRYRREGSEWRLSERIKVPSSSSGIYPIVSDGKQVVGVYQTSTVPPDLFVYHPGWISIRILTKINAQLDDLTFSKTRTLQWVTGDGIKVTGLLFEPIGYVRGQRYPLVIQTKGLGTSFVCDSGGSSHDPGFAPQPIASGGMFYLGRTKSSNGDDLSDVEEAEHNPKNYPGGLGEAAHQMDIWESAIHYLDSEGLIDPKKVGIVGFSRTGWQVEFDLFRSKFRFAAASVEDNVQYSLGEYFLFAKQFGTADADNMYGGPPYGATLQNWLAYSISFNMDKIHTPLLMESMGYGAHDDTPNKVPLTIAVPSEVFVGLNRLSKPVEWYYYPDDVHQPESPVTRLTTIRRNVDWYRFWLQGYERSNPEDAEQYVRWRHLRDLRDADMKASKPENAVSNLPKAAERNRQ